MSGGGSPFSWNGVSRDESVGSIAKKRDMMGSIFSGGDCDTNAFYAPNGDSVLPIGGQ
jgi:hypothetical protein